MPINPNYQIENPEIKELLLRLGESLKKNMPFGYGFTLLIFGFHNHELFYLSSATREDMKKAMLEFLEKV